MKTNPSLNGGVRFYVSILPALFPAIVFLMISVNPQPVMMSTPKMELDPLINRVREIYTSQIGVRESKSNAGTAVGQYLKYVGLPTGNPWCAAFVCWVYGEAKVTNPRSGWSPDLFGERYVVWGKGAESFTRVESGKLKAESVHRFAYSQLLSGRVGSDRTFYPPPQTTDLRLQTSVPRPEVGDVFGIFFPEKGRIAHVGFVDEWQEPWVTTVEGNTNISGSREGDGVYRKRRLVRSVYKVSRFIGGGL